MRINIAFNIIFFLSLTIYCPAQNFQGIQTDNLFSSLDRAFNQMQPATPEDEYYIGRAVAANILASNELYTENNELLIYLNLICQALVINSNYPALYNGYYVMILDNPEYNAYATPAGHIFITKGLIEAATSEDAIAGIIAHELAHIKLRHGMKIIDDMKIMEEIDLMARQADAFSGNLNRQTAVFRDSVNEMFYAMAKSGYSIPQEYEADVTAAELLAKAGYNPNGLLEMLYILQRIQGNKSGGFNDTHPTPSQRIENLKRQIHLNFIKNNNYERTERFNKITGRGR